MLKAAGEHFAAVRGTDDAYNKMNRNVIFLAQIMHLVETALLTNGIAYAESKKIAINMFWEQVYECAKLHLRYRDKSYVGRFSKQSKYVLTLAECGI